MSRPSGQQTDIEPLETWEYHLILSRLAPHWRLLYELLWETGFRIGEAMAITRHDLADGSVWVTSEKRADHLRVKVPLSVSLYSRLKIYVLSHKGDRVWEFSQAAAWLALKKAAIAANVRTARGQTTIHPHLFRHGFGRRVVKADMGGKSALEQLTLAKDMMRHKDIKSTERYINPSKKDVQDAFRQVNKGI